MAKLPSTSLTIPLITSLDDHDLAMVCSAIDGQGRIYTWIKATHYFLNSNATKDVVAKTAAEVKLFRKLSNQTAVQFSNALWDKALQYGNAFFVIVLTQQSIWFNLSLFPVFLLFFTVWYLCMQSCVE